MLPIILASSSPYRKALLQRLQLPFESASPNIDETPLNNEPAKTLTMRLAMLKAKALATDYPRHLIIGSDQATTLNDQIIGKPYHFEQAFKQLKAASGQTLCFYTGLALFNSASGTLQVETVPFYVHFRELSNQSIINYLNQEQPYDCAGSFKIEGLGISLFKSTQGEDLTSLMGLPLIKLVDMLHNEKVSIP